MNRVLRPLGLELGTPKAYPADRDIAASVVKWCNHVLLAGNYWDLRVKTEDIFQVPSQTLNIHMYAISVTALDVVKQVVLTGKNTLPGLEEKIGTTLDDLSVIGGILYLNRKIEYRPGVLPRRKARKGLKVEHDRPCCIVEDAYWLDVYTPAGPLLRIFADSIGGFWVPPDSEDTLAQEVSAIINYFPEPDDVILTWHELAQVANLDRTKVYLQACFAGAYWERVVFGTDNSVPPSEDVIHSPVTTAPEGAFADFLTTMTMEAEDPNFVFPAFEYVRKYSSLAVLDYYQYQTDGILKLMPRTIPVMPTPIPGGVIRRDAEGNILPDESQYAIYVMAYQTQQNALKWEEVPRPPFYGTSQPTPYRPFEYARILHIRVVRFLIQACGTSVRYLGNGLFAVKADGLKQLAAGSGNWGTPEVAAVGIAVTVTTVSKAAVVVGAIAAVISAGAAIYRLANQAEITRQLNECYQKTGAECEACVKQSMGYFLNTVQASAAWISVVAGAIAAIAGGPLGWAVGTGLILVGGLLVAICRDQDAQNLIRQCYKQPS